MLAGLINDITPEMKMYKQCILSAIIITFIEYVSGYILNIKFSEESFDAIFMGAVIHNFPKEVVKELLFSIHKWLKKDGKILIYTTIHNKSEEGYYEKEDYSGKIVRFRKKFTENELKELLEEFKFKIVFKMYTEEPDRNKKWLTYIVEKVE